MDFYSVLDAGRSHYLQHYRAALTRYREEFTPSAAEVTIERTGSKEPRPYCYYRLDLASGAVSPPNLTEVNIDPHTSLAPTVFEPRPGLRVTLSSFVWNGVEFVADAPPADPSCIASWVEHWLDLNDAKPTDADGLAGVVHSVTSPSVDANGWSFSVDFGSAPVDAVRELLARLHEAGLKTLRVGSFYLEKDSET